MRRTSALGLLGLLAAILLPAVGASAQTATFNGDRPWERYAFGQLDTPKQGVQLRYDRFTLVEHVGPKLSHRWFPATKAQEEMFAAIHGGNASERITWRGPAPGMGRALNPRLRQGEVGDFFALDFDSVASVAFSGKMEQNILEKGEVVGTEKEEPPTYETWAEYMPDGKHIRVLFVEFHTDTVNVFRCGNDLDMVALKLRGRQMPVFWKKTPPAPVPAPAPTYESLSAPAPFRFYLPASGVQMSKEIVSTPSYQQYTIATGAWWIGWAQRCAATNTCPPGTVIPPVSP